MSVSGPASSSSLTSIAMDTVDDAQQQQQHAVVMTPEDGRRHRFFSKHGMVAHVAARPEGGAPIEAADAVDKAVKEVMRGLLIGYLLVLYFIFNACTYKSGPITDYSVINSTITPPLPANVTGFFPYSALLACRSDHTGTPSIVGSYVYNLAPLLVGLFTAYAVSMLVSTIAFSYKWSLVFLKWETVVLKDLRGSELFFNFLVLVLLVMCSLYRDVFSEGITDEETCEWPLVPDPEGGASLVYTFRVLVESNLAAVSGDTLHGLRRAQLKLFLVTGFFTLCITLLMSYYDGFDVASKSTAGKVLSVRYYIVRSHYVKKEKVLRTLQGLRCLFTSPSEIDNTTNDEFYAKYVAGAHVLPRGAEGLRQRWCVCGKGYDGEPGDDACSVSITQWRLDGDPAVTGAP